nr:hypothetical protein [Angustibacter aerolatus]
MPQVHVSVAGADRSVDAGTTAAALFEDAARGPQAVVVARVNGEPGRPLARAGRR